MDPTDAARELYQMTLECQGHGFNDSCRCRERMRRALEEAQEGARADEKARALNPEYRHYAKDLR